MQIRRTPLQKWMLKQFLCNKGPRKLSPPISQVSQQVHQGGWAASRPLNLSGGLQRHHGCQLLVTGHSKQTSQLFSAWEKNVAYESSTSTNRALLKAVENLPNRDICLKKYSRIYMNFQNQISSVSLCPLLLGQRC